MAREGENGETKRVPDAVVAARIAGERARVLANIAAQRGERPATAFWLSFADDDGFRGALIVHATEFIEAVMQTNLRGVNPGGECVGVKISAEDAAQIPERWKMRRLSREDCARFDAELSLGGLVFARRAGEGGRVMPRYAEFKFPYRRVAHPDFRHHFGEGSAGFPVIAFERDRFITLTDEQVKRYVSNRKTVEALGGRMILPQHEFAGLNAVFTDRDLQAMRRAIRKAYPEWKIRDEWNGVGTYTFSISLKKKGK